MAIKQFNVNDRQSFLELTEDSTIREAAYPISEWKQNGGSSTLLGYPVSYQDDPPDIEIRGGLLNPYHVNKTIKQDPESRVKNIAAHWCKVESHPFYAWLTMNENFVKAIEKFQKKKKSTTSKKLHSEFADFRFVRIIAMDIGYQLIAEKVGYIPAYADRKLLVKTKGYVSNLRTSLKVGVRLSDWTKQRNLERLLEQLQQEIENQPRKERATATSEKRKCIETIALEMLLAFDLISATILSDLAAMINWHPDHTTIDKIVRSTKEKYRKALAKALLKTPV